MSTGRNNAVTVQAALVRAANNLGDMALFGSVLKEAEKELGVGVSREYAIGILKSNRFRVHKIDGRMLVWMPENETDSPNS